MKIENMKIEAIKPYPGNAKAHPRNQVNKIAQSIQEYGFQVPILLDKENVIITGHGRLLAAKKLKMESVPTVRMDHLTDAQVRAFRLMDNRSNESDWLPEDLANELKLLSLEGFDLELTGFDGVEIEKLFDIKEGLTDPDEVPEVPKVAIAKPGDIWLCGKHRIMAGDSTKTEDVERLMDGVKADMVFTDPPYGVNVKGGSKGNKTIAGDLTQTAIPFSFDLAVQSATKSDARFYFCGGEGNLGLYDKLFDRFLRQLPRHLIWMKNGFVMKPNNYHNQYEIIYFGYGPKGGDLAHWFSGRTESEASDIWQVKRDAGSAYLHPTQKPVELPERAIKNSSPPGAVVYDPFGGSGSTLIAAEQTGRTAYLMEIDPLYVDVTVQRWEDYTGEKGVLE